MPAVGSWGELPAKQRDGHDRGPDAQPDREGIGARRREEVEDPYAAMLRWCPGRGNTTDGLARAGLSAHLAGARGRAGRQAGIGPGWGRTPGRQRGAPPGRIEGGGEGPQEPATYRLRGAGQGA